jgi:NADPH:quinone reductase-like Zn-dependent oxidoreductase
MEGAHYARNFMNKVPLKPGDAVLVYGATGAIGSAAVPLLKHAGMRVTAVCAGEHHAAVTALGADAVLDYTRGDWRGELKGRKFPFVFDAVGKSTFGYCKPLLREDGVYISSELGPWGQNIFFSLLAPLMRGPKVRFPLPLDIPATLDLVVPLLAAGKFSPLIDRRYPLEEIREAFGYVASGRKVGNVVVTFEDFIR